MTPYNQAGDNLPFASIGSREDWVSGLYSASGLILSGTQADLTATFSPYEPVIYYLVGGPIRGKILKIADPPSNPIPNVTAVKVINSAMTIALIAPVGFAQGTNRPPILNYTKDMTTTVTITSDGSTATAHCSDIHELSIDSQVTIAGTGTGYDGTQTVVSMPDSTTFTFNSSLTSSATGTCTYTITKWNCLISSGAIDIPISALSTTQGAGSPDLTNVVAGDILYYYIPEGKLAVYHPAAGLTTSPAYSDTVCYSPGTDNSYRIPLGIVLSANLIDAPYYITVRWLSQLGLGTGVNSNTVVIDNHSELSDIVTETPENPNTWVWKYNTNNPHSLGHAAYSPKVLKIPATIDAGVAEGNLVEYVRSTTTIQNSTNNPNNPLLGFVLAKGDGYAYVQVGGLWKVGSSSNYGEYTTSPKFVNTSSLKKGASLYDYGHFSAGRIHTEQPTYPTPTKKVGIVVDNNSANPAILVTILDMFSHFADEVYTLAGTLGAIADVQSLPSWERQNIDSTKYTQAIDRQRVIAGGPSVQIQPILQTVESGTGAAKYLFSLAENVNHKRVPGGFYRALATDNLTFPASISSANTAIRDTELGWSHFPSMNSIVYIPSQGTLTFNYTPSSAFNPFLVSSTYSDKSLDSVTGSPQYKIGLPWTGIILLVYGDTLHAQAAAALISYHGYSGYGTGSSSIPGHLTLYNVTFFKKPSADGQSWVNTPWVGSNPGSSIPPQTYLSSPAYEAGKNPSWNVNSTNLQGPWPGTSNSAWYMRVWPFGGVRLRIKGKGIFSSVVLPKDSSGLRSPSNYQYGDAFRASKRPVINYGAAFNIATYSNASLGRYETVSEAANLTDYATFDTVDANTSTDAKVGVWTGGGTDATNLPASISTILRNMYTGMDITSASSIISYDTDIAGNANAVGSISGYLNNLPSVLWMDRKELWLNLSYVPTTFFSDIITNIIGFVVGPEKFGSSTNPDDATEVELTIAQSGVGDPEDFKYMLDSVLVGTEEFYDVMEGDRIRFFVKKRTNAPALIR
jgi:hypothetical protein